MHKARVFAAAAFALLLVAACGSSGNYGDILNGGSRTYDIRGTVGSVDTNSRTISIDPGYGSYVTVDWVSNTPVYFNGQTYAPGDLEVGDQVNVRVNGGNSSRASAQDITVTRSISGNNSSSSNNG